MNYANRKVTGRTMQFRDHQLTHSFFVFQLTYKFVFILFFVNVHFQGKETNIKLLLNDFWIYV